MAKKINTDLFGNQIITDSRQILLMHNVQEDKTFKAMWSELGSNFSMNVLKALYSMVNTRIGAYRICDIENPEKTLQCMYPPKDGLKYKKDYEKYLAYIFSNKQNVYILYSLLDEATKNMWAYLFFHGYESLDELAKNTGRKWFKESTRYSYWDNDLSANYDTCTLMVVTQHSYYYRTKRSVYLNEFFWKIFKESILPELFKDQLTSEGRDTLPEDILWQTYSNEKSIGNQIQVVGQLNQQNAIEFGEKKMNSTVVKKIDKQLNVPEFFPDAKENNLKFLAASLNIPILSSLLYKYNESLTEYHNALKLIFSKYSMRYVLFDMLSHLKGMNRNDVLDYAYYDDHEKLLQWSLKTMNTGKWYSFVEIQKRMYACPDAKFHYMTIFTSRMADSRNIEKPDGETLSPGDFYDEVQCPVTCGYLALYAACGLLEVAYNGSEGIGAYSFINYVRLTKLGAYVFGITSSYEAEGVHKPIEYFEAEPDRLIIFCKQIDGKNPYEGLLTSIAEKISANRWRVTPKTWLNGCANVKDLIKKENFVKDNICTEPSEAWNAFFAKMIERCNPLRVPELHYIVRQLAPSNKELQQLFLTDSYLRKHTLRGENFTILIEKKFVTKVEEKLRDYGYLV